MYNLMNAKTYLISFLLKYFPVIFADEYSNVLQLLNTIYKYSKELP